ncbi:MAG: ABC transporter substrate-binding protein [Acidimicrobiales bacterium]
MAAVVISAALLLAACSSSPSSSANGKGTTVPTGGTPSTGGTAVWAELPGSAPNFIFPFDPPGLFSVPNISQFQYLMYRPLYWFGQGTTPDLNLSLSLGKQPVYSNNSQTVTIDLDPYMWSNGETVSAQDVVFWMNMMHADKNSFGAYVPGIDAIPDDVTNVVATSPTEVTFTLSGPVNTNWYTYNNLSQITPMPKAWDVTAAGAAPGSGGCFSGTYGSASTDTACTKVFDYLATEAGYNPSNPKAANNSFSTYATNPLWQIVDGPWHLTSFDATGNVTMEPNSSYSGPVKPKLAKFVEAPFTDEPTEYNALLGGKLNVGYLPLANVSKATTNPEVVAAQDSRLSDFYLNEYYGWEFAYFPLNFNSTGNGGTAGKIMSQLYFRQAMQTLVDQPAIIQKVFKGYGAPEYGPVPVLPVTSFLSSGEKTNPYPYSQSAAEHLLSSHGWSIKAGGTDTCTKPGTGSDECGAGIPAGTPLSLDLQFATGITTQTEAVNDEISSWESAGIHINETTSTFDTVIGNATACTPGPSCTWEMEDWAGSWVYSPDVYPTGEELFATGAVANYGSYSDATDDANIKATDFTSASLDNYENYLAKQVPVIYLPDQVQSLTEIQNNLRGVTPQNPLSTVTPEDWYYVK